MRKNKVSMKDIARIAGVSTATVSLVINEKAAEWKISRRKIARVLDVISELGYQPDLFARNLRIGKSGNIGFLVDDITKPFFSGMAKALEEKLAELGYDILISSFGKKGENFPNAVKFLKSRCVDGYIIAGTVFIANFLKELLLLSPPLVIFDQYISDIDGHFVLTDNFKAAYDATRYLLEQGFSNIGFIVDEYLSSQAVERLEGYRSALSNYNRLGIVLKLSLEKGTDLKNNVSDFRHLSSETDALIFGSSEVMKIGLQVASKSKMDIFKSKGIITFDDFDVLRYLTPSITAISQPIEEIANNIIKTLLEEFGHESSKEKDLLNIKIAADLILRESSTRLKPTN